MEDLTKLTLKELRIKARNEHIPSWWNKNTQELLADFAKLNEKEAQSEAAAPEQLESKVETAETPKSSTKASARTVQGVPLRDYCKTHNLPYFTIYDRLYRLGWPEEKALNTPVRKREKHE